MKKTFQNFNFPFRGLVLGSLSVNIALIVFVLLFRTNFLPPEVPLFYGLPQGQEQLANSLFLVLPAGISIGLLLTNLILSNLFKNNFLKKMLVISGVFSVLFPVATTLKIIFLVGSF